MTIQKITMVNIKDNFLQSIGNTPLIKLKAASEITGCNIYGKAAVSYTHLRAHET